MEGRKKRREKERDGGREGRRKWIMIKAYSET